MNANDHHDMSRLRQAIFTSRRKLQPFRENRLEAIKQFTGSHYGDNNKQSQVPLNYHELAISIYTQKMVGGPPRAYIATERQELVAAAADLKHALDHIADKIKLEITLQDLVQDALLSWGIAKIGTAKPAADGWWNGAGEPYVARVDLDDWVHDTAAKSWDQIAFCGNRFRIPIEAVKASDSYDAKARKALQPTLKLSTNEAGDERVETVSHGGETEVDEYEDEVELWEVWLPRQQQVITISLEDDSIPTLRTVDWDGPANGPFRALGFNPLSSQIMPLPPVAIWTDIHDLANDIFIKIGRQAKREKSVLPFRGGNEGDIQRVNETPDGNSVRLEGEVPKEVRFGGPSQINLAMLPILNDIFNRHSGNTEVLGGLGSQAKTLGQEKLIDENATDRVTYMRRKVFQFTDDIFTDLAHYLYSDPLVTLDLSKPIAGTDISVPYQFSPESRQGESSLFQVAIEPYSLIHRTPRQQFQMTMQIIQEVIMPIAPEMIAANLEPILRLAADKLNLPELKHLFFSQPQPGAGPGGDKPRMPTNTTRNYTRTSVPGASHANQDAALAQTLMGNMPQPAEAGAMLKGMS